MNSPVFESSLLLDLSKWSRTAPDTENKIIRSAIVENPILHANFYRTGLTVHQSSTLRKWGILPFLLLWPWPWPDDLHIKTWPVSSQIVPADRKMSYLSTSRLSKVIVLHTYRQTDRHADRFHRKRHHASSRAVTKWSIVCAIIRYMTRIRVVGPISCILE